MKLTSTRSAFAIAQQIFVDPQTRSVQIGDETFNGFSDVDAPGLVRWLYGALHIGNTKTTAAVSRDTALEERIVALLPKGDIAVPAQLIASVPVPLIEVDRVRINARPDEAGRIHLPRVRPNLTPGFLMFVNDGPSSTSAPVRRFYVAADSPDWAIRLWAQAVQELSSARRIFRAKVLSRAESYPRNDALVFYSREDAPYVETALKGVVTEFENEIGPLLEGSPLCEHLMGPLSTAEDPGLRGRAEQSFGEHRCTAIAEAIGDVVWGGIDWQEALANRLYQAGVDPEDVSRNRQDGEAVDG